MKYKKVAVLMGGPSAEREVSLRSGAAVAKGLRQAGYDVQEIDVKAYEVNIPSEIEAVFIAMHGEFGEDGQIQQILQDQGMPFTGSGPESSKASFDKVLSKKIFIRNNIPTPRYELLNAGGQATLPLPVVVKPARQGSSIGVHKVETGLEWSAAFMDALKYDANVIVEEFIKGRELTVGIVCGRVLPVIEIVAPDHWYDFEAKYKYTKGKTDYLVPAPISKKATTECQKLAMDVFKSLGCEGMGRIDFLMTADEKLYALELNNIPGFTETSLLPKSAASAGISFPELCDMIMQSARKHS